MTIDSVILKQANDLVELSNEVWSKKEHDFTARDTGTRYYTVPGHLATQWAVRVLNFLERVCGGNSVHLNEFRKEYERFSGHGTQFLKCQAVLVAARDDIENGSLLSYRGFVKAETFEEHLDAASSLLDDSQKDLACVVAGIVLESSLRELCARNRIEPGKMDRMNAGLTKAGAYNMGRQKQITAWAHLRNKSAHGEWGEYDAQQVASMIEGIRGLIADVL